MPRAAAARARTVREEGEREGEEEGKVAPGRRGEASRALRDDDRTRLAARSRSRGSLGS